MIHQVCFTFSERLMSLIFAKTMRSKNIVRSGVRTNKTPIHLKKLNYFIFLFLCPFWPWATKKNKTKRKKQFGSWNPFFLVNQANEKT